MDQGNRIYTSKVLSIQHYHGNIIHTNHGNGTQQNKDFKIFKNPLVNDHLLTPLLSMVTWDWERVCRVFDDILWQKYIRKSIIKRNLRKNMDFLPQLFRLSINYFFKWEKRHEFQINSDSLKCFCNILRFGEFDLGKYRMKFK